MNKKILFLLFALIPIIDQVFTKVIENYFISFTIRIIVLILFPIIYTIKVQNKDWTKNFRQKVSSKILIILYRIFSNHINL